MPQGSAAQNERFPVTLVAEAVNRFAVDVEADRPNRSVGDERVDPAGRDGRNLKDSCRGFTAGHCLVANRTADDWQVSPQQVV